MMSEGGNLQLLFDADAWDSVISFQPGIPVTVGGNLELSFATDVDLTSQIGRTFRIFEWTGVNPAGQFRIASPYTWDSSHLYTTGEVTLTGVPEPSARALLSLAAVGGTLARRRRIAQSVSKTQQRVRHDSN